MKQLLWIGMAWITALVVLLLDERYYHMFAYPAYLMGIVLLLAALLFGRRLTAPRRGSSSGRSACSPRSSSRSPRRWHWRA